MGWLHRCDFDPGSVAGRPSSPLFHRCLVFGGLFHTDTIDSRDPRICKTACHALRVGSSFCGATATLWLPKNPCLRWAVVRLLARTRRTSSSKWSCFSYFDRKNGDEPMVPYGLSIASKNRQLLVDVESHRLR